MYYIINKTRLFSIPSTHILLSKYTPNCGSNKDEFSLFIILLFRFHLESLAHTSS